MSKQTKSSGQPAKAGVKREKQKKPLTPRDLMKLEVADELGLLGKIKAVGWAGLSAQEAGVIGGVMSHRLRKLPEQ